MAFVQEEKRNSLEQALRLEYRGILVLNYLVGCNIYSTGITPAQQEQIWMYLTMNRLQPKIMEAVASPLDRVQLERDGVMVSYAPLILPPLSRYHDRSLPAHIARVATVAWKVMPRVYCPHCHGIMKGHSPLILSAQRRLHGRLCPAHIARTITVPW
ncbi:hypothetical protein DPMN_105651 [Dreissena polymorpha]|uniref:Uncharacterized protein n=1 Tax=Dreissena polymorpha TaxID=45954 RepID=A0A9D4QHZ5_DREPO|nr:hypothetical protein DPMN_105651 [Dreissena polymorpha]